MFASTLSNCDITSAWNASSAYRETRQFIRLHPRDLSTRSIYLPIKSPALLSRLNWQLRDYAIAFVLKHPLERVDTWPGNVIQGFLGSERQRRITLVRRRSISFMNSRGKNGGKGERRGSMERKERRTGFYPIC